VTALSGALARDWWRNLRSGTAAADARQGGEDQPPAEVLRPTALFYQEPLEEGDESVAAFERLIRLAGGPQPVPATPAAAPETAAAAPAPVENVNVVDAVFADGARPWAVRLFVAGIAAALIAALAAERHRGRAAPPPAVGMAA
jgi:hypothetical protein